MGTRSSKQHAKGGSQVVVLRCKFVVVALDELMLHVCTFGSTCWRKLNITQGVIFNVVFILYEGTCILVLCICIQLIPVASWLSRNFNSSGEDK